MINLTFIEIMTIVFVHFVADFMVQTDWQAKNKSTSNVALTQHVSTYSLCWLLPIAILFWGGPFNIIGGLLLSILFMGITFSCHWVTDYITSRINSKLWAQGDTHNFFVSVGFDQVLHYLQLFGVYYILKNI